jgi:hypothetical protein
MAAISEADTQLGSVGASMMTYTIETKNHVIEVSGNCLTIGTKRFPDDCVSLTPEETEEVLKLLLMGMHNVVSMAALLDRHDQI